MQILSNDWLALATVASTAVAAAGYLRGAKQRALRRASELEGAATALEAHYRALDLVADDPAIPLEALEMLVNFSEALDSEEFCAGLTDALSSGEQAKDRPPGWFYEVEALRKTRPDLAEEFFRAIASGLTAAFFRWPGNSHKIARMAEAFSQGDRKEVVLAERMSRARRLGEPRVPVAA